MSDMTILRPGKTFFSKADLFDIACACKRLTFRLGSEKSSVTCSEDVAHYTLDKTLIEALAAQGIRRHMRGDGREDIFTLVDENPQPKPPQGYSADRHWNFKQKENCEDFDLTVSLYIRLQLDCKQGIIMEASTSSTGVSPITLRPNYRMFKVLVENDPQAPPVAKELIITKGRFVVPWSAMGLDGLRSLSDLFDEFVGDHENIRSLSYHLDVFSPRVSTTVLEEELFVAASAHQELFSTWSKQLEDFRASITR